MIFKYKNLDLLLLAILSFILFYRSLGIYFLSENIEHIESARYLLTSFQYETYFRPIWALSLLTPTEAREKGIEKIIPGDKCLFRNHIEDAINGTGETALLRRLNSEFGKTLLIHHYIRQRFIRHGFTGITE